METPDENQTVKCPACSHQTPCRTVSTITKGTKELTALFGGDLNKTTCKSCFVEFLVEIPLIYRDDKARFLVYYSPLTRDDQLSEITQFMEKLDSQLFEGLSSQEKPICRLTLSRRDFIEKIAIRQHGYDDRLIEYIKYQLFQHSKKGLDPHRMDLLFDFSNTNNKHLGFLAFDRTTKEAVYSLNFLHADYDHLGEYFLRKNEMEIRLNRLFKKYFVHVSSLL